MRTAKLTRAEFEALAKAGGEVVNENGDRLYFDKSIEAFMVDLYIVMTQEIVGLWDYFDGENEFTIIKEPNAEVELTWSGNVTPEEVEESLAKALEKPELPAFEDIDWVMVEAPEGITSINNMTLLNEKLDCSTGCYKFEYPVAKYLYENSKDFKVTWKLKEKPAFKVGEWVECGNAVTKVLEGDENNEAFKPINRKLYENRALAIAVGKWLVENSPIKVGEYSVLCAVIDVKNSKRPFKFLGESGLRHEATLPADLDLTPFIEQYCIERAKEQQRGL